MKTNNIVYILSGIRLLIWIILFFLFLIKTKKYNWQYISFLLLIGFLIARRVLKFFDLNSEVRANFLIICVNIAIYLFYTNLLKRYKKQQKILRLFSLTIIFGMIGITIVLHSNSNLYFNLINFPLAVILFILYSTTHYYNQITDKKLFFYFNKGIIFFTALNIIGFLLYLSHNIVRSYILPLPSIYDIILLFSDTVLLIFTIKEYLYIRKNKISKIIL